MNRLLILLYLLINGSIAYAQQSYLALNSYSGQQRITDPLSITLLPGFHIPAGNNVVLSIAGSPNIGSNPTVGQNYILTRTFKVPGVNANNINTVRTIAVENQSIQYFDGLGRPIQTVDLMASPNYKDIVQHIEYDGFGRESKKYLPYTEQSSNNGSYKSLAKSNQSAFYKVEGGWDANVMKTANPYAETIFENSPLNRVLEQGAPGAVWQPAASRTSTSGNTVALELGTNTANDVKLWKIEVNDIGARSTSSYLDGKLYKTITKDENWRTGKTGTIEEYKDFEDRVVLKRIWESESKKLETYYVYDDFGNLRFVIPPGFTASTITENDPTFNELIYAYKYDERRRLVEKKIPGKGWEYIVYNKNDQPILSQDGVQRAAKKWSYTKYDAFGRVTETGLYTNATVNQTTRIQIQNLANGATIFWESRIEVANYTNSSFPTTGFTPLLINYYDDYTFNGATTATLQAVGITESLKTKTLLTGSRVFKDNGTSDLLSINYYDDRARLIQSASQNHLTGTDYVTNTYSFVGELLTSKRDHKANVGGAVTTLLTTNKYDHVGRLLDTRHKVNAQTEVILARNEYNEIGQLKNKKQHSENNGTNFINETKYNYNERGWTTKATSSHFTYQLNYNVGTGTNPAQYNGNISQQLWGHGTTNTPNVYSYAYDKLNRLLSGTSTGTVMSEVLVYDEMGNIKTLKRDNGTTTTYNYTVNSVASNRLQALSGGLTGTYTYDVNGNAKTDRTGMTFTYNHLNLPKSATKSGTSVNYLYDAMGIKLRKTAVVGGTTTVRDYLGGIEYSKVGTGAQAIELIHTGEGYLQRNTSNNTYTYHYNLSDHLGNVRAVLYKNPITGVIETVQQTDYYPFGKQKTLKAGINKYLYNGKEVQSELGDQQDYGARFYDAEIGRWNVVDPLAEQMRRHSPYNYAFNNPIRFIDPDGRGPNDFVRRGDGSIYWDKDANDQASTKAGEEYLGKTLAFSFNSYIDAKLWDGPMGDAPAGDKLTTTVYVTGNENSSGELTSISAGKHVTIGETPMGTARDFYPGLGNDQNKFSATAANGSFNVNMEQHASVSPIEQAGMNAMGFNIVNVAQKLNVNINSQGNVSVSTFTDVFPSASLSVNGSSIMKYNQPSFRATHGASVIGYGGGSAGFAPVMPKPIYDIKLKPAAWYKRY